MCADVKRRYEKFKFNFRKGEEGRGKETETQRQRKERSIQNPGAQARTRLSQQEGLKGPSSAPTTQQHPTIQTSRI